MTTEELATWYKKCLDLKSENNDLRNIIDCYQNALITIASQPEKKNILGRVMEDSSKEIAKIALRAKLIASPPDEG